MVIKEVTKNGKVLGYVIYREFWDRLFSMDDRKYIGTDGLKFWYIESLVKDFLFETKEEAKQKLDEMSSSIKTTTVKF